MTPEVDITRSIMRRDMLPLFQKNMSKSERKDLAPYIDIAQAQLSHLRFMQWCWGRKREMSVGLHTWYLCKQIDIAFENFRKGTSTFLVNLLCFRHGKSEITTRFLPAHFLAEFPDRNVIVTSHSTKKTNEFSRFGRALIRSQPFKHLYPGINIATDNSGVEEWGIEGNEGIAHFYGILSGSAGTGGALVVTDDYFGGREDAESQGARDKIWEAYSNNIFTRRDDPSINLITVTPWHPDDLVGRIQKTMKDNTDGTPYKIVRMPYKEPEEDLLVEIQSAINTEEDSELRRMLQKDLERYAGGGYLFPQKYSAQWYIDMENALGGPGGYGTVSLMRCNPKHRTGNNFKTENAKVLKQEEFDSRVKGLTFVRGWDLASSTKQLVKSDPDYTVGVRLAVRWLPSRIKGIYSAEVFVADVIRGRWEAAKRNEKILETAIADGLIKVGIETFGQYKDAYTELKGILRGIRVVNKVMLQGDKLAKAATLQPIFEASNFYVLEGHWNQKYLDEFANFPGAHDDQVDATEVAVGMVKPVEVGFQYEEQYIL